jgi:predicted MFS family arabinose efflux permease
MNIRNMLPKSTALRFVLLIGIVNLFADLTYEGARSVTGPYLGILGASALVIGSVAGFGEFVGYALRSVSGFLADKTHKYWVVTFVGYAVNMLAVPALALAGNWPMAAALIIAERTGRAIRKPAVETMISYTSRHMGSGWAFGLNEALDQGGATVGPLVVALVLYLKGGYQHGFAVLLIPALLCLGTLVVARLLYPRPQELETKAPESFQTKGFPPAYWWYVAAGALIAAGFADFSLIAFHFQQAAIAPSDVIPIFYAVAMAVGALTALLFGRLFDRVGFPMVLLAFFLSAFFAPLVFLGTFWLALLGMVLWGLGMGVQDSLLKAVLTGVVAADKRSTAFGVFDTGFGIAWFLGSAAMGFLYQQSIPALIVFSVVAQLAALPVFLVAKKQDRPFLSR